MPANKALDQMVFETTTKALFRHCKFLVNDEQLFEACEEVMLEIPDLKALASVEDEGQKKANINSFMATYGETICKGINTARTNVQAGLKKAYEARFGRDEVMPSPTQLATVIRRKDLEVDPEDPSKNAQNRDFFMWYWEHLLPKVAGKDAWGHNIRCYGLISTHCPPDSPDTKYINNSDEALVLTLYENCGQRFPYTASCLKSGEKPDIFHPKYQSKWSDSRSGQSKWGGFDLAGRQRFKQLREKIAKAKKKEHVKEVEQAVLDMIQEKHQIGKASAPKKNGPNPRDYEDNEDAIIDWRYDSDASLESGEDDGDEIEEFEEVYKQPPKKKRVGTFDPET